MRPGTVFMRALGSQRLRALLVRALGSVLALGVTFAVLPLGDVGRALTSIAVLPWSLMLAAYLVGHVVAGLKWRVLIGTDLGVGAALRAHFAGLGANLFLPGTAGGDIVRAVVGMRSSGAKTALALGSLIDRLIDTAGLLVLSGAAVIAIGLPAAGITSRFAIAAGLVVALLVSVALCLCLLPCVAKRLPGLLSHRATEQVSAAWIAMTRRPLRIFGVFIVSMMIQALFVVLSSKIGNVMGVDVSIAVWLFAWPLAKLLSVLPLGIAGLGVREAGLAALMLPFGADPSAVVAAGLAWQSVVFTGGGIGALIFVLLTRPRPSSASMGEAPINGAAR